jgi:peptidoglycan/xylan/chitin deacetylase (PgdA/CDA1 family)
LGCAIRGGLFFGNFLLAAQKKVTCPGSTTQKFWFITRPPARSALNKFLLAAFLATTLSTPAFSAECKGTLHLTFDTGTMSQADLIARTLKEENVQATFFLANEPTARGDHSLDPSWAGYWRNLVADGHSFGNHTWSHYYRWRDVADGKVQAVDDHGKTVTLDRAQFCAELKKVDDAFHRDTGRHLAGLWRAPGGRPTQQTVRWAASCGYPLHAQWDDAGFIGDELPSDKHPNEQLLQRALKNIHGGDVVMMHLGIRSRAQPAAPILKPLIQGLKAKGYCFAPLAVTTR